MTENNVVLIPANEIVGVFLSKAAHNDDEIKKALAEDTKATLTTLTGVDFSTASFDVHIAYNEADKVHLLLPYYDALDKAMAEAVSDSDMQAAGGFEYVALTAAFVSVIGTVSLVLGFSNKLGGFVAGGVVLGAAAATQAAVMVGAAGGAIGGGITAANNEK